jgi:hypothetical protein
MARSNERQTEGPSTTLRSGRETMEGFRFHEE